MKTYNVAIVGGGLQCLAVMDMISEDRLRELQMRLVGIADINPDAPGLKRAQGLNIYTTNDYHDLFGIPALEFIIELTGKPEVSQAIQREKSEHVHLVDHRVAMLFWDFLRLEDEKLKSEKEAEQKLKSERDRTSKILNSLDVSVLVLRNDHTIENVNDTFLGEFKLSRDDVVGKRCFQIMFNRKECCQDTFCPMAKFPFGLFTDRRKELVFQRDGKNNYYDADYIPLADEEGNFNRWLITIREITHRKRLRLALEKSQKKYKDLFDNAREGLVLFDEHGKILESNLSFTRMVHRTKDELDNMPISELAKGYSSKILENHLEGLKILGFTAVEMDFLKKQGASVPLEITITWLPDENLFRIMARDVTIKRKLEESRRLYSERLEKEVMKRTKELKASEAETRKQKRTAEGIIYGSPIPMFVLNKDHKIAYWNKECENLTGFTGEEMIGTDRQWKPFYPHKRPLLADLVIENDIETIERLYKDMQLRKSPVVEGAYEAERFFPHLGKEGIHLYLMATPIKDDDDKIEGVIVTYQDFTERIKMTQALKRREAFVQNLIQNSIDGIIATEEKGQIAIFNRGAAEILGYAPDEIIGKLKYRDILTDETGKNIREAFYGEQFGPPGKIINMETKLLNNDDEAIPVRLSGTLLYEDEKELGSVVFIQDLREVRRLQREKEQAQRMAAIGRTVAGLAHYIKNILNGLRGGAYVINSAVSKEDIGLVQKGWDMVDKNIDQISNIVNDMLIYSSERTPRFEWVDSNTLLEEVLEITEQRAKISGVTIVRKLTKDLSPVALDKTGIHRCLLNLISNAIDACALEGIVNGKGIVTVSADRPEGWAVRFQVADNGTGMSEETQRRLYTDFFTTKGYKGTGLGLPVTQKIVEEHGGELTFESIVGRGTTFTLKLPLRNLKDNETGMRPARIT